MAATTSSAPGVSLVEQAISSPTQFGFGELLSNPSVRALASHPAGSPEARAHSLACLFACGVWTEYASSPQAKTLTATQEHKLKLLSLVSLVSGQHELQYAQPEALVFLGCSDPRDAESVIVDAIASGLVSGHIDELSKTLYIAFVSSSRDLTLGTTPNAPNLHALAAQLERWAATISRAQADLSKQVEQLRQEPDKKLATQVEHEKLIASRMPLALWQAANKPHKSRVDQAHRRSEGVPARDMDWEYEDISTGSRSGRQGTGKKSKGKGVPSGSRAVRHKRSRQGNAFSSALSAPDEEDTVMEG